MDGYTSNEQMNHLLDCLKERLGCLAEEITLGSLMVSDQIGDGSSREQAASCQRVLGGFANLANTYSTKRYRSNLINWGIASSAYGGDTPDTGGNLSAGSGCEKGAGAGSGRDCGAGFKSPGRQSGEGYFLPAGSSD